MNFSYLISPSVVVNETGGRRSAVLSTLPMGGIRENGVALPFEAAERSDEAADPDL